MVAMLPTLGTSAALAAPAADPPPPSSGAQATAVEGSGDGRAPLTPAQVQAQLKQAARLQKQLEASNAEIAAANAELTRLAARSSAAMSAVAQARAAEQQARRREQVHLARLTSLSREATAARQDVTNMAYDAYVNGSGSLRRVAALVEIATGDQGTSPDASLVEYLAEARAADGRRYRSLARAQQITAKAAVAARKSREAATRRAVSAQAEVTATLTAQQGALAHLQKTAIAHKADLAELGVDAGSVTGGVDVSRLGALTSKPLCTKDSGDYPNGMFPASALCPIAGSAGHMMRPAAARALNALKVAYAKDFGTSLCISDTYRTYAAQVDVKARKPTLAATPGTSNHGLGLATDLCGGIEDFGTPQHQWMKRHAALFGYYHPAWAEPGGSKPEPWHWEFAG